jgi:predicted permease
LGVGIALNTSAYSLIDAYLLQPLPYPEAHRIFRVETPTEAVSWTDTDEVFEVTVSSDLDGFTLLDDGPPEVVLGAWTTPSFFQVYGVRPALGRFFAPEEARSGGRPVAVISHDLWSSRYDGDRGVLGRTLRVYSSDRRTESASVEIIGVLPHDFWFPNGYTQVLLPMPEDGAAEVGRLRTDVPPDRAESLLTALAREKGGEDVPPGFRMEIQSLQDAHTARIRPRLITFQLAALLVLMVAGVNAILLVLIRATSRGRDLAVRRALGAGRGRLAVHFLLQGWILGALASGVGVVLASQGLRVFGGLLEARLGRSVPGGTEALAFGASGWLVALGSCLVVGTLLGLMPLFVTSRGGLAGRMRDAGIRTTDSTGVRRLRNAFVGLEVALSLTLLIGGALMVRSALHLERIDLGFRADDLFAFTIGQTSEGADQAADRVAFFRSLEGRAAALPGVQNAGLIRSAPFSGNLTPRTIQAEGTSEASEIPEAIPQAASPGYLESLGVEPAAGTWFSHGHTLGTAPVAVVSQALADRAWPGQSPIGRRVRFTAWNMRDMSEEPGPWLRVIGVAPDIVSRIDPWPEVVYLPHAQAANAWMDLVIRSRPGVPPSTRAVQDLLRDLDPDVPIYASISVAEAVDEARAPARFFTAILGGFSLVAFALALVGFYGVAAYAFRQRRRDVAIRVVLGADRGVVERAFVRGTLLTLLVGVLLGVAGGRYLGSVLQSQLHGVAPDDLLSAMVVTALFAATAVLAAWIPARQAAGVDPMTVLREE